VGNALITLYAKCGFLDDAWQSFDKMVKRDVVSWTAMIAGYSHYGHFDKGLEIFCQMLNEIHKPDQFTLVCVLRAFTSPAALKRLLQVHAYIIQIGNGLNVLVASALVDAYAKCGSLEYAQQVFDKMPIQNVDSWNALISGYAKYGRVDDARELFNRMQDRDIFSSDCSKYLDSDYVIQLFDHLPECSWNAIGIGHYQGKSKAVIQVFRDIPERNVVSWTTMIAAYAQHGYDEEALKLFCQMQQASMKIGPFIFSTVLSACASLATFEPGRQVHGYIIKTGHDSQLSVSNSLMTMYAKCGSMDDTHQVFLKMPEHNVVSWTAMICAYAQHGFGRKAVHFFERMLQAGVKPDHVTFTGVLSACSHAGLVDEGHVYFHSISEEHFLRPNTDHYTCMIDLLCRVGNLNEAENLINNLPHVPDTRMWGILLGACQRYGNIEIGKRAAECLIDVEPHNTGTYVMLSNMYAAAGRWNDVAKVRKMMKDRGVKKEPGCSWIQIRNRVHTFVAGDRSHPLIGRIYSMLEKLQPQMEAAGYVPDMRFALHAMEKEHK
jgi:pentatricopeptide repeat protein